MILRVVRLVLLVPLSFKVLLAAAGQTRYPITCRRATDRAKEARQRKYRSGALIL
jgi:hypothetical protein